MKLTYHLQRYYISYVQAVLIIEHYLKKKKNNETKDAGYELMRNIIKCFLSNKSSQIYQLASLFTSDGIVRFRMKNKNQYNFLAKDDFLPNKELFTSTHVNISFQNVNSCKIDEYEKYKTILDNFKKIILPY